MFFKDCTKLGTCSRRSTKRNPNESDSSASGKFSLVPYKILAFDMLSSASGNKCNKQVPKNTPAPKHDISENAKRCLDKIRGSASEA